jgi:16S rRNA (guanine527-N7)-methyltransferase
MANPRALPARIDSPDAFAAAFGVSRETRARLILFHDLVLRWQKTVNLVAPSTLPSLWHRHLADSAQIAVLIPAHARTLVDLGSGAGFPGLVVAILFSDRAGFQVSLVESDQRKAAFLREVARQTGIAVDIVCSRIENPETHARLTPVDVVTARALAPLDKLLTLAVPLFGAETLGLFLKGRAAAQEMADAQARWRFDHRITQSLTDADACVVSVRHLAPVEEG